MPYERFLNSNFTKGGKVEKKRFTYYKVKQPIF